MVSYWFELAWRVSYIAYSRATAERPLTLPSALLSCVLAAVTNNNEALLFEPEKNAYKGVWKEVSAVDSLSDTLD